MIFKEAKLKGAYIIEIEPIEDNRGFFARSFCQKEFEKHGIDMSIVQCNISYNKKKGTLRGMHYQANPYEEAKIVSCTSGAIYDVIIDLRPDSPTYCKWVSVELSAESRESSAHRSPLTLYPAHRSPLTAHYRMLYIPKGFAHGFITLEDDSTVYYQMSEFYAPGYGRGVRWNDPVFRIEWPDEISIISDQDKTYQNFEP